MSRRKKNRTSPILVIVLLIAIFVFGYSAFRLIKYELQTRQTIKVSSELADKIRVEKDISAEEDAAETNEAGEPLSDAERMRKKYGRLYEENEDFIGWLSIEGTGISYPVMFTPNDGAYGQYYLRKNFYKEYDIGGSLFIDYRCVLAPDEEMTTNTIIYGHRMNNGTMFGPLQDYKDPEFCADFPYIQFDTLYHPGSYVIFAVFLADANESDPADEKYYNFINADDEYELEDFVELCQSEALYFDEQNAPVFGDQILTLSTCDYYAEEGRLAIAARRLRDDE